MKHYVVVNDKLHAKCGNCGTTVRSGSEESKEWEMQHFHYSDGEIEFLTCSKCKTLPMSELAEKATAQEAGAKE